MVGVLFWNTGIPKADADRKRIDRIEDAIAEITVEHGCSIIVLAEYAANTERLCDKLSLKDRDFSERKSISGIPRVVILAENRLKSAVVCDSDTYFMLQDFSFSDRHILLGGVHFPSKLYAKGADQEIIGRRMARDVREAVGTVGHENVVLMGDFNANPFESVMTGFDCLHAIYDAETVEQKRYRTVFHEKQQLFYNPMWNRLGDDNHPKGSYYSEDGRAERLYWNVFDQVIMSADFIRAYERDSLKILTGTAKHSFLDGKGKPDRTYYSDHLPIVFSFREDLL